MEKRKENGGFGETGSGVAKPKSSIDIALRAISTDDVFGGFGETYSGIENPRSSLDVSMDDGIPTFVSGLYSSVTLRNI